MVFRGVAKGEGKGAHPPSVLPQYNTHWYVPVCLLEVSISL